MKIFLNFEDLNLLKRISIIKIIKLHIFIIHILEQPKLLKKFLKKNTVSKLEEEPKKQDKLLKDNLIILKKKNEQNLIN